MTGNLKSKSVGTSRIGNWCIWLLVFRLLFWHLFPFAKRKFFFSKIGKQKNLSDFYQVHSTRIILWICFIKEEKCIHISVWVKSCFFFFFQGWFLATSIILFVAGQMTYRYLTKWAFDWTDIWTFKKIVFRKYFPFFLIPVCLLELCDNIVSKTNIDTVTSQKVTGRLVFWQTKTKLNKYHAFKNKK